jgi:hypothetical protein
MRYHSNETEVNFEEVGGGHGQSLRGIWTSGSAFDHLAISFVMVAVCFRKNGHHAHICRRGQKRRGVLERRVSYKGVGIQSLQGQKFWRA